ncbi:hypothetical protein LTR56_010325 [Elasticomyces elasticus]|nr:hypothetical protein LTR56_010325 [Elasticomyces elasticus]KAK3656893.1 hypothetical protein LTR22_009555 [Elasticomyces elasticus]KAK5766124.1 hypothetical protein LTS12_003607 [Elasticomyces elasticus]
MEACRLLALPTELRLLIYEACFGPPKERDFGWGWSDCWFHHQLDSSKEYQDVALLQTCRQIWREAQPVLNERNVPCIRDKWLEKPKDGHDYESDILPEDRLEFLKRVPTIRIVISSPVNSITIRSKKEILLDMFEALGQGKNVKDLSISIGEPFLDCWWCRPELDDFGFGDMFDSLQCAENAFVHCGHEHSRAHAIEDTNGRPGR